MNQPKGLTVDDRGNIYIADTMNMAIRKISDTGKCYVYCTTFSTGEMKFLDPPKTDNSCSTFAFVPFPFLIFYPETVLVIHSIGETIFTFLITIRELI